MAGQPDPQTLKQQAITALAIARSDLTGTWDQAREQFSPKKIIHESIEKHRVAVIVAAAVAGFVAIRWMMPGGENSRDTFSKPARKRTFSSFLLKGLWGLGREPLQILATQQLLPLALKFVTQFQSPLSKQPPSE